MSPLINNTIQQSKINIIDRDAIGIVIITNSILKIYHRQYRIDPAI